MHQPDMVANPPRGQLNWGNGGYPAPNGRSRLRIWSYETGSAVPPRVSPLILYTLADYGAYSRAPVHKHVCMCGHPI